MIEIRKELTPQQVVDYANDNTTVWLITTDETPHEIKLAYCEYDIYYFTAVDGKEFRLENVVKNEAFEDDNGIRIYTADGVWSLCAEEEYFDFKADEIHFKELREIRACIKRDRKLEAYINRELGFHKDCPIKARIRFVAQIDTEYYDGEISPYEYQYPLYTCYFGVRIINANGIFFCTDEMPVLLDMNNKKALNHLLFALRSEPPTIVVCNEI